MTRPLPTSFGYKPALDGVRAVAVCAVLLYHLGYPWAKGGFLGVDVFFVMSGYLITSLLIVEYATKQSIDLKAFWLRRARRLLPALFLLIGGVLLAAALGIIPSDQLRTVRADSFATLGYVANWKFIFSGNSYFDLFAAPSPLRHMWSLAIEEQFYVVWPLIAILALRTRTLRRLGAVAIVGILGSVLAMAVLYDIGGQSRAYYGTDARIHEILIGVLLAVVLARWSPATDRSGLILRRLGRLSGILVGLAFVFLPDSSALYYRGGSLVFASLTALWIGSLVVPGWSAREARVLTARSTRWIGQVSYGMYLWHWPLILWVDHLIAPTGLVRFAVVVALTMAVTAASYYFVEMPVRRTAVPVPRIVRRLAAGAAVVALATLPATLGATTNVLAAEETFAIPAPETLLSASAANDLASEPADSERGEPLREEPQTGAPALEVPASESAKLRVLGIIGDSVAFTLAPGLELAGAEAGIVVVPAAFRGCGVAAGFQLDGTGEAYEWSQRCVDEVQPAHDLLLASYEPDALFWYSAYEAGNRRGDGGEVIWRGTDAHAAAVMDALEGALDRLAANGTALLISPVIPRPGATAESVPHIVRYNELLDEFAARHPDRVVVVDLFSIVCPGGLPCPAEVGGVELRPDGFHYTEASAELVARRLLPLLTEAYVNLRSR